MKILITTGIYPPDIGGPATYSKLLFDKLPERGVEVKILSFGEVRNLPKIIRHFVYFYKILIRGRKVDVIYAQDPVSVGFPTMLANKILKKRFLIRIAGDYAWEQGVQRFEVKDKLDDFSAQKDKYGFFVSLFKKIQTKVAQSAERIIVPSRYFKGVIENWGIDSEKIKVIYNGIDIFKNVEARLPRFPRGLNNGGKVLLSVGRLVPWKGFDVLIECMPEILKNYPDLQLKIVGEGPQRQELEGLIKNLDLEENVILTGQIVREELLLLKKEADIFLFNTNWESFSFDTVECMNLRLPVITTKVGSLPELIQDDIDGILIEPNNKKQILSAIVKIFVNDQFREKIIENAYNKSKQFSIENTLNNLEKVLK
ncbi:MAG: glycosyltransferase family 4 protein [Candidatus Pacebacteria bacterium]|nr:glycosyltransferase family 4 protein [Candidatus Paceibacterota bacterium]